jgi:hypothetical protein
VRLRLSKVSCRFADRSSSFRLHTTMSSTYALRKWLPRSAIRKASE